jgi:hypothetical protein
MTRPRHPLALCCLVLAVPLLLLAAACGGGGDDDDTAQTLAEMYAPGTCFDFTEDGGLAQDQDQIVECGTPHDGEIVAHLTFPAPEAEAPFPGADQLRAFGDPECQAALSEYTGLALPQLDVAAILLFPTEATWADGDRTILCAASRDDGLLQGSIAAGDDGTPTAPTTLVELPEPAEGECFLFTTPDVIAGATIVDCAEPHQGEVYAVIGAGAADAAFPGDEALSSLAGTECGARLGEFAGGQLPDVVRATAFQPAETAWANGDRDIECVIVPTGEGTISGSAEGQGS